MARLGLEIPPVARTMRARQTEYKENYNALVVSTHYANMSVQYTAIFHGCKNDNFQMKNFDIFLIFAQNFDCGYTLKSSQ